MKGKTALMFLTVLMALILCGAVSAENTPLNTTHNGTVSGDLYVNATQPVAWVDQPTDATSREFNTTYNLPTDESANGTDIEWAQVYVNIYSGSGSANWPVNVTILLDGDGNGVYETTLGNELLTSDNYSTDGTIYWINDHCFRVYSDYQLWYDVTGLITCTNPSVYVKTEQVGTESFDGRLKMITLITAYNDGDNDQVHYWVNDGQDWISSGETTQTTFQTSTVDVDIESATLNTITLSSKDGTYDINGTSHNGTDPVSPINYFIAHTWDVTAAVTRDNDSTLTYTAGSGSFKAVLATLTVRESVIATPEANFTTDTTSGSAPLTVNFTDTSTGATEWLWDFGDGTNSTEQNPIHTYNDAGTYTVNLTVTGPGGTDTKTKTNYIAVIPKNYVTYLGGTDTDKGYSIDVDNEGNMYIVGNTKSADFPTTSDAYQSSNAGSYDTFLVKFDSNGNLVYSTYLGGTGSDTGFSIEVNNEGNIYITGTTTSTDFPTTSDAYQTSNAGGTDTYLVKFNSNGSLVYSTYFGGIGNDRYRSNDVLAVDSAGNVYISGYTTSTDFPVTSGAFQTTSAGGDEVFVTKFNSTGGLVYSTYLGGTGGDRGYGIAVDSEGCAYVTGYAGSGFPTTTGAYQTTNVNTYDVFVTKLNSTGTGLIYSTYLGGSSTDIAYCIAVDSTGSAYITGETSSSDFPVTSGAYQTTRVGDAEIFVSKLNPDGTNLPYSTFIGKSGADYAYGIAVDSMECVYITGYTRNSNYPVTSDAYQKTSGGAYKVIITKLNPDGTDLTYSTFIGGSANWNVGNAIALDSDGNVYATGYTASTDFLVTSTAYQSTNAGGSYDAFVAKLSLTTVVAPVADFTANSTTGYTPLTVQFTDQSTSETQLAGWTWDFGDGTTSHLQNPTHTYTTGGNYTVTLTVTNSGASDEEVKTDYIVVTQDAEAPLVSATPTSSNITTTIQVTLSATDTIDPNPVIYYTTNGDDPTTNSTPYTDPINITKTTTLKFIAIDASGNNSPVQSEIYTDTEAPTASADPASGTFTLLTNVTIIATDNLDTTPAIYYTTNGDDPTINNTLYTGVISIMRTTTLKFIAVDESGNTSPVTTETYTIIDKEAPLVSADPTTGTYNLNSTVTLTATDNVDTNPIIYYTTNGNDPTNNSTVYTDPINLPNYETTTTLKFIAVDESGNTSPITTETYTTTDLEAPIVTANYSSGQYEPWYPIGSNQYEYYGVNDTVMNVTLSATDNADPNPTIYYTLDGSDPTTSSTPYSAPIPLLAYNITTLKFIAVDASGNISPVQNRTYNTYSTDRYLGSRFNNGNDLVNNAVYAEGNIGVRILEYGGYYWFEGSGTATWTAIDLNIPEGATLISARVYQAITWYSYPNFTLQFNGHDTQQPIGTYWDNIAGQNVFDVTEYFNLYEDNTAVITGGQRPYGAILVVIYEAASEPYQQIWINEGAECLMTSPPLNGFTTFDNVTTNNLVSAKITTVMLSGESGDVNNPNKVGDADNIYLNGQLFYRSGYGIGADPGIYYFNVTSALQNGTNELGVWGASYLNFAIGVLEVTKQATAADLAVSDLNVTEEANLTANYPVTATISNLGETGVTDFTVRLYDNGVTIGKQIISLASGNSQTVSFPWTAATTGTHYLQIIADPANSVTELDEGNNQQLSTVTVTDVRPDLVVSNLTVPNNPALGTSYPVTVDVTNTGASAATFTVRLYEDGVSVRKQVITLTAGATTNLSFTWTPHTTGSHDLMVWADPTGSITELNKTNNQQNTTITVSDVRPDIELTNLTTPTNPELGTSYPVTVDVSNNGTNDATFTVRLYEDGVSVGKQVITLTAGSNTTLSFTWTPTTTGSHDLMVWADPTGSVDEVSESNNQLTTSLSVADLRPDLEVTNLVVPDSPSTGTSYPVVVDITNNGATSVTFTVRFYEDGVCVGKQVINLDAGDSTTLLFAWTPTTSGSHELMIWADPANSIIETDETNNQQLTTVSVA